MLHARRASQFVRSPVFLLYAVASALFIIAIGCGRVSEQGSARATSVAAADSIQWLTLRLPGGTVVASVARPAGTGSFPALLLLHGTHGFAQEYVQLARALASRGFIVVAACWFRGGSGAGLRFVTPIPCPDALEMSVGTSPSAQQTVTALVRAVRALPGVRADRVALFGQSRGGVAALEYALATGDIQALVLNSTAYPPEFITRASALSVPVLILHGSRDSPDDGGSAMTAVERARAFEAALRARGQHVEATYTDGGHNTLFTSQSERAAAVQRIAAFLAVQLAH